MRFSSHYRADVVPRRGHFSFPTTSRRCQSKDEILFNIFGSDPYLYTFLVRILIFTHYLVVVLYFTQHRFR